MLLPGPMKQCSRKRIAYCTDVCECTVSVALYSGPILGNESRQSDFFMARPDPFRGPWTLLNPEPGGMTHHRETQEGRPQEKGQEEEVVWQEQDSEQDV